MGESIIKLRRREMCALSNLLLTYQQWGRKGCPVGIRKQHGSPPLHKRQSGTGTPRSSPSGLAVTLLVCGVPWLLLTKAVNCHHLYPSPGPGLDEITPD